MAGLFDNSIVFDFEIEKKKSHERKTRDRDIQVLAEAFISNPSEINFNRLEKRIRWGIRHKIYGIVKTNDATKEVFNQTLEHIYFKRDMYDSKKGKFSTWMYTIAVNNALKWKEHGDKVLDSIDTNIDDIYDDTVFENENFDSSADKELCVYNVEAYDIIAENGKYIKYDKEKIIAELYNASVGCIDTLPVGIKTVMYDRLINNKKIEDIAVDNNIPLSSVKNWLRKGKTLLQKNIKSENSELFKMYLSMNEAI